MLKAKFFKEQVALQLGERCQRCSLGVPGCALMSSRDLIDFQPLLISQSFVKCYR
jgi:hypothetical protein